MKKYREFSTLALCLICGEGLYDGSELADHEGHIYHEQCLEQYAYDDEDEQP